MSAHNIQQFIRDSVPDEGFWQDVDLFNSVRGHTGLLLTGSTTPVLDLTSDYLMFKWAAASTATAYVKHRFGRELAYQQNKTAGANTYNIPIPRFRLNAALRMAGSTDATTRVTVTAILRAANGAQKGTFTPTSIESDGSTLTNGTCKYVSNQTNPLVYTWDFSNVYASGPLYAAPGDSIDFKIVPGSHGTDALECHQLYLQVANNLAYTIESQRV